MADKKPGRVNVPEFKELARASGEQEKSHALNHIARTLDDINHHLSVIAGALVQTEQHGQHSVKVSLASISGSIEKIAGEIAMKR